MEYSIVSENEDWLVVNKPAGKSVHMETTDESKSNTLGVVAELKQQLKLPFLAPVHRLDKVTSGCLLLAKNSNTAAVLSTQFSKKEVNKFYLAITKGKPKKKQGSIIGDMSPARRGNWKIMTTRNNPATTQFFSFGFAEGLRLSVIKLVTGKTHQIRVALKSNGSPIWGDSRYADSQQCQLADRCYLHCWYMQFYFHKKSINVSCLPEQGAIFSTDMFLNHEALSRAPMELSWPNKK